MLPIPQHYRRKITGFSLVEIMVGMIIGLLGMIIMMQVLALIHGRPKERRLCWEASASRGHSCLRHSLGERPRGAMLLGLKVAL